MRGAFVLRQIVDLEYGAHRLSLETVVQKRDDELIMIGLTPVAGKAFTLVLRGSELSYDSDLWRNLPFPPCWILRDFARIHFPITTIARTTDTITGTVAGERTIEHRRSGRPYRREIGASTFGGARVVVEYAEWNVSGNLPTRATLKDRKSGYTVTFIIVSLDELQT